MASQLEAQGGCRSADVLSSSCFSPTGSPL
jgi:hypothetical protein